MVYLPLNWQDAANPNQQTFLQQQVWVNYTIILYKMIFFVVTKLYSPLKLLKACFSKGTRFDISSEKSEKLRNIVSIICTSQSGRKRVSKHMLYGYPQAIHLCVGSSCRLHQVSSPLIQDYLKQTPHQSGIGQYNTDSDPGSHAHTYSDTQIVFKACFYSICATLDSKHMKCTIPELITHCNHVGYPLA